MTADPFMERVQARVVDLAEQSWRDARLAETEAARPDFTSRTDSNGDEWPDTFGYESDAGRWFNPSETRPLAVKAGWNDDEDDLGEYEAVGDWTLCGELDDYDYRTISDHFPTGPRPSLWTRISEHRGLLLWRALLAVVTLLVGALDFASGHPVIGSLLLFACALNVVHGAVVAWTGRVL